MFLGPVINGFESHLKQYNTACDVKHSSIACLVDLDSVRLNSCGLGLNYQKSLRISSRLERQRPWEEFCFSNTFNSQLQDVSLWTPTALFSFLVQCFSKQRENCVSYDSYWFLH
jgi:hypothetical protein